jgi:hypothetical protein
MFLKQYIAGGIFGDSEALEALLAHAQKDDADRLILLGNYAAGPSNPDAWRDLVQNSRGRTGKDAAEAAFKIARGEYLDSELMAQKELLDQSGISYVVVPGQQDDNDSLVKVFGERAVHSTSYEMGDSKVLAYGGGGFVLDEFAAVHSRLSGMGLCSDYTTDKLRELLAEHNPNIVLSHQTPKGLFDFAVGDGRRTGSPILRKFIEREIPLWVTNNVNSWSDGKEADPRYGMVTDKARGLRTLVLNPGWLGRAKKFNPLTRESSPLGVPYGTFIRLFTDENGVPYDYDVFFVGNDKRGITEAKPVGATFEIKKRSRVVSLQTTDSGIILASGGFDPMSEQIDERALAGIAGQGIDPRGRPSISGLSDPRSQLGREELFIGGGQKKDQPRTGDFGLPVVRLPEIKPIIIERREEPVRDDFVTTLVLPLDSPRQSEPGLPVLEKLVVEDRAPEQSALELSDQPTGRVDISPPAPLDLGEIITTGDRRPGLDLSAVLGTTDRGPDSPILDLERFQTPSVEARPNIQFGSPDLDQSTGFKLDKVRVTLPLGLTQTEEPVSPQLPQSPQTGLMDEQRVVDLPVHKYGTKPDIPLIVLPSPSDEPLQ